MIDRTKVRLLERQAEIAKAVAHPLRMAVLDFLKDGEKCVCEIAEHIGSERSNISRHLSVMVKAGVLDCRKEGLWVIYRLKAKCIVDFLSCTTTCLRQQAKENGKLLKVL